MLSATPDGGLPAELHRLAKSDRLVTDRLLRRGPASQAELVAATGLSRPTVLAALTKLTKRGLVEVTPGQDGPAHAAGRRPHLYRLTARAGLAVGVEIGRRHLNLVVMDAGHQRIVNLEKRGRSGR